MDPAVTAAIIAAGTTATAAGMNWAASGKMNKKTREYNKWAFKESRKNALEDWHRQNAYNHPAQQMQRLREAGLNPHLIYNSSSGTQTAAPIATTTPGAWNPQTPDVGAVLTNPVNAYLEMRSVNAQNQQLKAQTTKINAEVLKILADVDTTKFDLKQKERLADIVAAIQEETLEGIKINNELNKDENIRRNLTTAQNLETGLINMVKLLTEVDLNRMMLQKGNEEIKNYKQMREKVKVEINNLVKSGKILDFEASLADAGMTKNDPLIARVMYEVITSAGLTKDKLIEKVKKIVEADKETSEKQKQTIMKGILKVLPFGSLISK